MRKVCGTCGRNNRSRRASCGRCGAELPFVEKGPAQQPSTYEWPSKGTEVEILTLAWARVVPRGVVQGDGRIRITDGAGFYDAHARVEVDHPRQLRVVK